MDARILLLLLPLGLAAAPPAASGGTSWHARLDVIRNGSAPWAPGDTLTFGAALLRAFDYSPSIRAVASRIEAAEADASQASARPNPTLLFDGENLGGSYSGLDHSELSLLLTQEFELGGRRGARVAAAGEAARVAGLNAHIDSLTLYLETRRRYTNVVHAEERYRIAIRASAVVAELVAAADERVTAGAALQSDRALAAAALARSRMEDNAANGGRRRARTALAALWGESYFAEPVAMNLPALVASLPVDAAPRWAAESPAVALGHVASGVLRAERAVEQSLRVPSLTAGIGVRRLEIDNASTYLVGLSLPLPLWDRRGDAIRAADARVRAAELATSQLQSEVTSNLAVRLELLTQLRAQVSQVDAEVIPQLLAAADGLRTAYRLGRASYPDLLEVQRTLVAIEQEQNDNRRAIMDEIVAIEELAGTPIEEMIHE